VKILLFKVNQLGDNVVFLPIVEQLVRDFGGKSIHLFTSTAASALYQDIVPLDQIYHFQTLFFNDSWKHPLRFFRLLALVRRIKPNVILLAEDQGNCAHLLSLLSGAQLKVGVKRPFLKVAFSINCPVPSRENDPRALASWRILEEFYSKIGKNKPLPISPPRPTLPGDLSRGISYDFVIHPGASREYQKWGVEKHAALANLLARKHRVAWVVSGGDVSARLSDRVERHETPELKDLISLLRAARIFIGNNSGPMNLAVALGVPGIVVCGPSRLEWDPYWSPENYLFLRASGLACLPCDKSDRPAGRCTNTVMPMGCMAYWSVEKIYEESLRWLQLKGDIVTSL
jgi:ADP-heptose:LPS heptosyltransferase